MTSRRRGQPQELVIVSVGSKISWYTQNEAVLIGGVIDQKKVFVICHVHIYILVPLLARSSSP